MNEVSNIKRVYKAKFEVEVEVDENELSKSELSESYEYLIANGIVTGNADISLIQKTFHKESPEEDQKPDSIQSGEKVSIPAWSVDFVIGEKTVWITSPTGSTTMRLKTAGKINLEICNTSPTSHCDIELKEDINFCISKDATI